MFPKTPALLFDASHHDVDRGRDGRRRLILVASLLLSRLSALVAHVIRVKNEDRR